MELKWPQGVAFLVCGEVGDLTNNIDLLIYNYKRSVYKNKQEKEKNMEYQFKKFEKKNMRLENRITITKSNSIGFPQKFYQDNGIKKFKYSVLFWDEKNKAVGIHFTSEEEKGGFKIIHGQKYGGQIVVRSFLRTYNINPQIYYGRYEWEKYNLEGVGEVFIIKLKERDKK